MDWNFSADAFSCRLRNLYLVAWQIQCFRLSLGRELAVHRAALYRFNRVYIYRMAFIYRTLDHPRPFHLRYRREGHAPSCLLVFFRDWSSRVLIPSRRWNLEFSLQMGFGRDR